MTKQMSFENGAHEQLNIFPPQLNLIQSDLMGKCAAAARFVEIFHLKCDASQADAFVLIKIGAWT